MADSANGLVEHYEAELHKVFAGRKLLLIGGPVASLTDRARALRRLGAERPFIIGSSLGSGELPGEEDAEWISLELSASTPNEAMRAYEKQLTHLPEEVRQVVDAYDPARSAVALGTIVLGEVPQVGGRPRYGARPRTWAALEDKVAIDAFWDGIGVAHAPHRIVRPALPGILDAARELDRGVGTVWAADAREGVHGGAEGVRWVRGEEQAREACEFFSTRCDRVRVAPFVEGIPCSIHGIVFPDGVAVFRPIEMLTLRRTGSTRFMYAGCATYWDPPAADRDYMREVARTTARALAERVGFRGAFTIDGVLGKDGFWPTELNPRIGIGLSVLESSLGGLPLVLLALATQAGQNLDYRPEELEELVVARGDAQRAGGAWTVVGAPIARTQEYGLLFDATEPRFATDGEPKQATLLTGPSDVGGFVRYSPDPSTIRPGPPFAPRAVSVFEFVDRELGVPFGQLEAARPVR